MIMAALAALLLLAPASSARSDERRIFDLINRERAAARLPKLAWDEAAARAARAHSARMRDAGFFAHDDPERGGVARRATAARIGWTAIAENIFTCKGYRQPAEVAVKGWMKSPGHRRNLLDPHYTRTGVGIVTAPDGTYHMTQIYFRP